MKVRFPRVTVVVADMVGRVTFERVKLELRRDKRSVAETAVKWGVEVNSILLIWYQQIIHNTRCGGLSNGFTM